MRMSHAKVIDPIPTECSPRQHPRRGALIVWGAFLLVVVVAMTGMVIDTGLMLAGHRQAQNAADAAALAAANQRFRGSSISTAQSTGTTYVTDAAYNNLGKANSRLSGVNVVINIPPVTGPYAGNSRYAEAIVTATIDTIFLQVVDAIASNDRTFSARAVAGYEETQIGAGVISLNPNAKPGLKVSGQAELIVDGAVIVNSEGGGVDENGETSLIGSGQNGTTVNNNGLLKAESVDIVGGVNSTGLDNIENIDEDGPHPLHANQPTTPDPLINLPTPTVSNGVVNALYGVTDGSMEIGDFGQIAAGGGNPGLPTSSGNGSWYDAATETVYLYPGIYDTINISGGNVVLEKGIYVIKPPATGNSGGLNITGGNVSGEGIMFYNTGHNYDATSGSPDSTDYLSISPPPPPDGANFADFFITDNANLTPLDTGSYTYPPGTPAEISAFDGMLYYQRRLSDAHVTITGDSSSSILEGTWYAKWGDVSIDGQGTYQGSFVVGSLKAEGQATMTIDPDEDSLPSAKQVYLVE